MKAKIRKVGNSLGFILPIIEFQERDLQAGDFAEVSIVGSALCKKHKGSLKGTCGCK